MYFTQQHRAALKHSVERAVAGMGEGDAKMVFQVILYLIRDLETVENDSARRECRHIYRSVALDAARAGCNTYARPSWSTDDETVSRLQATLHNLNGLAETMGSIEEKLWAMRPVLPAKK